MTAFLAQPHADCPSKGSRGPVIHSLIVWVILQPLPQGKIPTTEVAPHWGWGTYRGRSWAPMGGPCPCPRSPMWLSAHVVVVALCGHPLFVSSPAMASQTGVFVSL